MASESNAIAPAAIPPAQTPIHERIREYIEEHGIRQNWVAKKLNVTSVWISYALRGMDKYEFTDAHVEILERVWQTKL